jgi:lipopolysaccharide transport system ATP-binding protein
MPTDPAILASHVSKRFQIYARPEDRLKQMVPLKLRRVLGLSRKTYFQDFEAVRDVSLTVGRGETVGIIGRNGSGKSTLLQMICGTLQPSEGSISIRGRIAALLELGAGFSPDFTGRQNVFLNCAILGLTEGETQARFETIERFADIGIFMDQPVKTYSSGMYIRLAFAVAINVDPDILVIDEALAVGDEAFQRKCFARIEQIRNNGATILFVSHGAQTILQLCDRAVLMDGGEKLMDGPPKPIVQQYQRLIHAGNAGREAIRSELRAMNLDGAPVPDSISVSATPVAASISGVAIFPGKEATSFETFDPDLKPQNTLHYGEDTETMSNLRIETLSGRQVNVLDSGKTYRLCYEAAFATDVAGIVFGMQIKTVSGLVVAGANTSMAGTSQVQQAPAGTRCSVIIEFTAQLVSGTYFLDAGIAMAGETLRFLHRVVDGLALRVSGENDVIEVGYVRTNPVFRTLIQDKGTQTLQSPAHPQPRAVHG